MLERRLSYLTIEHLEEGREGKPEIVLIPHPGDSPAVPKHSHQTAFTRDKIQKRTTLYWNYVWPIVWSALDEGSDEERLENALADIRAASASLASDIFGTRALEIIWRVARECEILRIETNLLDIPWEALVNPAHGDESFLAQLTSITRGYLLDSDMDRIYVTNVLPTRHLGLYVDAKLKQKWMADRGLKGALFRKIATRTEPKSFTSIEKLFADMKLHSIVGWICENEYDDELGDRLRLSEGTYCIRDVFLTKRLSHRSLLCLISCAEHRSTRLSEQIAAHIAIQSGCTVIGPLMPIAEQTGLTFLRLFVNYVSRAKRASHSDTLSDFLVKLRYRKVVGQPSELGLLLLFMGLYGSPNTELKA